MRQDSETSKHRIGQGAVYALLAAATLLALFFRLHRLDVAPPGICGDEAANGIDALLSLHHGRLEVFYPGNYGREGLFIWLLALSIKAFGINLIALRIPGVVIGAATASLAFFTTRRLVGFFRGNDSGSALDANLIAFLTAVFIAASQWHITFSRIAFRAILDPLFGLAAVYLMVRLLEAPSRKNAVLAGLATGVGLYGYSSFRFVVFPLLFLVVFDSWRRHGGIGRSLARCAANSRLWLYAVVVALVALPLVRVAAESPEKFFARAGAVSVFATEDPGAEFAASATSALGQFHVSGDPNWRHNVRGKPALSRLQGVFLLLALVAPLLSRRPRGGIGWAPVLFLASWALAGLLPAALTFQGRPHFLRSISAIPPVYILTAIGCWVVLMMLHQFVQARVSRRAAGVVTVAAAAAICVADIGGAYRDYFTTWAQHREVVDGFMHDVVVLAEKASELPENAEKYLVADEGWLIDPVRYLADIPDAETQAARHFQPLRPEEAMRLPPSDEERYFLLLRVDAEKLQTLRASSPNARFVW